MNFANPEWLIAWIALPIMAILAVLIARFRGQPWEKLSAERLRGRLIKNDHPLPRWMALGFLLASIGAFVVALARPQGDAGVKTEKMKGRNVMIALDLSRSMRVTDVSPDRLGQGKILIYEILEKLKSDRVGLIGFAGTPSLFAPLTIDHGALKETVEQIDEQWVSIGGSDISAAIKQATTTLKGTGQKNNLLVLISDGEENLGDLDAIIADAESAGVRIFSIGIGTEDGGFVPHDEYSGGYLLDESGNKILSRLQPDILRKLATSTNGRYVVAGSTGDIPALIEVAVQGMDVFEMEAGERKVLIEFFQWAVLPGIFFLMAAIVAGTRWRRITVAVFLAALFISPDMLRAESLLDAKMAFSQGDYKQARDSYRSLANKKKGDASARLRLAEGLSAYEAKDMRGARSAYSSALLSSDDRVVSEAHEGMGNTLFQLGWMGIAGNRYPKGSAAPEMEKFDEMVREQLHKMGDEKVPDEGETNGFIRFEAVIVNWSDAIRHYRSAALKNPKDDKPLKNAEMTMAYLTRLAELLEEEKEEIANAMMQMQQQGEGDGDGDPKKNPEDGGTGEPGEEKKPGEEGDEKEKDPNGKEKDNEKQNGDKPEEDDKPEDGEKPKDEGANPNETPEEEARRKLKENADIEKGPMTPGQRGFRIPKKDW